MYTIFKNDTAIILTDSPTEPSHGQSLRWQDVEGSDLLALFNTHAGEQVTFYHHDLDLLWKGFSSAFKMVEAAGGVVRNPLGQLLFIFRNDRWDLPKGKIEPGETREVAALREVKEECGLSDLRMDQFVATTYHIYEEKDVQVLKVTYWYAMESSSTAARPQLDEGITKVEWLERSTVEKRLENSYPNIRLLMGPFMH